MRGSPYFRYILRLMGYWPEGSRFWMPKDEAIRGLKEMTGRDFGDDLKVWAEWGKRHELFLGREYEWLLENYSDEEESAENS